MVQEKNKTNSPGKKKNSFKVYRNNSSNIALKNRLKNLQARSIECTKEKFYNRIANQLSGAQKNAKAYWSLTKMCLNNKKIPLILPLIVS